MDTTPAEKPQDTCIEDLCRVSKKTPKTIRVVKEPETPKNKETPKNTETSKKTETPDNAEPPKDKEEECVCDDTTWRKCDDDHFNYQHLIIFCIIVWFVLYLATIFRLV